MEPYINWDPMLCSKEWLLKHINTSINEAETFLKNTDNHCNPDTPAIVTYLDELCYYRNDTEANEIIMQYDRECICDLIQSVSILTGNSVFESFFC